MIYRSFLLILCLSFSSTAFARKCKNPLQSKTLSQLKQNSWCVLVKASQEANLSYEQQKEMNQVVKKTLPLAKEFKSQGLSIAKDLLKSLKKDKLDKAEVEDLRKEVIEHIDDGSKEVLDLGMEAIEILDVQQRKTMLDSIRKQIKR